MAWEFVGIDTNTNNNQPQGNIQQGNIQHKFKYVGFDFGMPEGEFLQQDEEPNIFNKFVGKIREFIGFDKNNNTNDYIQLLALKEGKKVKDVYKELQDTGFPVSMAQQNIHYALSGFFHQASLGILPDDVEKVKTGSKTEDFLVELSRAGASLGGFGVSLLYGGMASDGIKLFLNTSKFAKAGDKLLYLIENGKNLLPVVRERATATGIYRALKSAGNVGIVSGITSFIENNEKYNDVWQAVKKATPEALYNAALGAGIPLSQEFFNSRLGRAIFTIGLAESVNYLASGEITPQTIINAIKTSDPEMLAHGLFNAFLDVGFGIGAAFPEAKELAEKGEIKNYIEDLNRLGNHINELQKHNVVFTNVLLKTIEKHKQELLDYTQDVDKLAKQVENNIKAQQTILTKEMPEAIKQKTDDKQEPLVFVKPDEKSDFELVDKDNKNLIDFESYLLKEKSDIVKKALEIAKQDLDDWKGYTKTKDGIQLKKGIKPQWLTTTKKEAQKLLKELEKEDEKASDKAKSLLKDILNTYGEAYELPTVKDLYSEYENKFGEAIEKHFDQEKEKWNEDTTYMFGGVPIPPVKDIIEKNTLEIDGAKDLSVLAYLGNIHYLKDIAKDEVARQYLQKMYKVIDDANIKGAEHWYEYSKDVFTPIEALKKDINDKDVIKTVIEASVEADAKQVDPHKLFDEKLKKDISKEKYEKAHALIDKIFEYGKKVLREYEKLPDLLKETYGLDDKFVEEWKKYIYPKIRELKYWIPRIRNVGNVVIEVYKGNTKIHSQPITDLTVMFTPSKSVVAKFYEKKLREKYGEDVDIVVKYAREKPDFSKVDFMDIMTNVMQILDNHDIPDDVKREIITEAFNKIKSFGFTSHSIKRSDNWIRGYEENVLKAIETHFTMYNGFYQKQFMKAGFTKLFAEMPENLPRLKKVMQNVRDEMLRNKDYLDKAVAKARTLLYFKYLAGSIKNGFVNVVFQQPITAMHLSAYYENKSHLNYERSLARITKAGFDVLSGNLTEEEKRIFETLDRWGILKPLKTQFFLGRTALNSMNFNKFLKFLALPMGKTEEFSRRIAALSFIRTIKKDGLSINEIANFTKEFVKDTHGVYGDLGMPIVMQGKGGLKQLAKLGQTFQTYNHSVMMGVIKEAKMDKRNLVYIAKGLILLGALGGAQIFPMYEFGKKIYTEITGKDAEIELKKKGLDFLTEGLVHNLLGIDVSSSTSFSLPFDEFRYTGNIGDTIMSMAFGVAYQTIKDELKGAEYFFKGDYYKAIYHGLPARFLGYPFKAMQEYKMGITTNGDILLIDPYTGKPLKLTEKEFVLQFLGFTPSRIKEYKDLYYTYKTLSHYYDTKATRIRNRIRLAINNGNIEEARKWVYEMQKLNYKIYMLNKEGYGLPYHLVKTPKTMYNNSRFMMYMLNNFRR